jgi:hypothetical protein
MTASASLQSRRYTVASPRSYKALDPSKAKDVPPSKIEITDQQLHGDIPVQRPIQEVAAEGPPKPTTEGPSRPKGVKRRAVWIVHGMGQQVQFETLNSLAEGIMSVTKPPRDGEGFQPVMRAAKIGDMVVERVELKVRTDREQLELHLYEAFWAPITEGQVKLRDVTSFLFNGSTRGLVNSFKKFKRALFGQIVEFNIPSRAAWEISLALFTVAALFVLNAVIVAAGAAKYGLGGQQLLGLRAHWDVLTSLASALSAVALIFGAILFLAGLTKPPTLGPWGKWLVCALTWIAFGFTLLAVILGALSLGLYALFTAQLPAPPTTATKPIQVLATSTILMTSALVVAGFLFQAIRRSACQATANKKLFVIFFIAGFSLSLISLFGPLFLCLISVPESYLPGGVFNFLANPIWVWPFLLLLSYKVRELMIQYVGDVVAYISPNKLDRFCKIRAEIKDVAYKSISGLSGARLRWHSVV